MKKPLRENPDAGLVVLVLFFLIVIIAGMWLYQTKSMQKHLPQNRPPATSEKAGIPSLVLHGDLSQANIAVNHKNNTSNQADSSSAAGIQAGQDARHNANRENYSSASVDKKQRAAPPELKINVQPACGGNTGGSYANCIDGPLSSVESLVRNL